MEAPQPNSRILISHRLTVEMRILEFGCGASTIFLSQRVKEVVSFEIDSEWAKKTRESIKNGAIKIIDVKDLSDYSSYLDMINGKYDILIIDNLGDRMQCAANNLRHLKDNGVVIWDNTDGPDWTDIKSFMSKHSYKEISFTGMVAQELSYSKTTLFYRENNCLNI